MSSNTGGYRPIDSKREEFRKYLERAGVMDALTKVLVMLYEEVDKPQDALEFLIKNLCADRPETAELENLRTAMNALELKAQSLEEKNQILKQRLSQYEPVEDDEEDLGDEEGENPAEDSAGDAVPPTDG